jgi:hypothetical protein
MMSGTFANISTNSPNPVTDGIQYSNAKLLPASEADIYNGQAPQDPVGINVQNALYLFSSIKLVVAGSPGSGTAWVAVQTALADGIWYDLAWLELAAAVGNGTFSYAFGSNSTAITNWTLSRALNSDPGATGVNGVPLGALLRFTGKNGFNQGTVAASIYYKLQGLR